MVEPNPRTRSAAVLAAPEDSGMIHLCYIADVFVFRPTLVSMASAIEGTRRPMTIHLFSKDIPDEEMRLLENLAQCWPRVSFRHYDVSADMTQGCREPDGYYTSTRMAKLHIHKTIEGRVVYLDSDTLVHCDIGPLYDSDLNGRCIGAVRDIGTLWWQFRKMPRDRGAGSIDEEALMSPYRMADNFNAGVILFDADAINADPKLCAKLQDRLGRENDQPVLNHHFKGKVSFLDHSWNVFPGLHHLYPMLHHSMVDESVSASCGAPRISHFVGIAKPWHEFDLDALIASFDSERRKLFDSLNLGSRWSVNDILNMFHGEIGVWEYCAAVDAYRKCSRRIMSSLGGG